MIGGWNQAYQFDVLPLSAESHDHLRPGDLIFISGVRNIYLRIWRFGVFEVLGFKITHGWEIRYLSAG